MRKIVLLLTFCILVTNLFANLDKVIYQTKVSKLNALSIKYYNEWKQKHDEALIKAELRDIPVIIDNENVYMELSHFNEFDVPIYHIIENSNAAITISTDHVYPGGGAGLSLTGNGIVVREWDGGGVRMTHQELTGRLTNGDGVSGTHYHSTHVAGTIMASGFQANAKGMAYEATLKFFDWNSDTSEMATEAAAGMLLSNHSYGFGRGWVWTGSSWAWYGQTGDEDQYFGFYNSYSQEFDEIAYDAPYYLIIESAGNDRGDGPVGDPDHGQDGSHDGGYDCLADMAASKNVLTVAAVNDMTSTYSQPSDVVMSTFSSWGPCDDGRIKPDISANGVGLYSTYDTNDTAYNSISGTSMAAPSVTGSLALIQEHSDEINGVYLRSSTLKALTLHCADEAGSNDGPDYSFGWGLMNTERMANYISNEGIDVRILEETLSNGGTYQIVLPANGTEPFKATLCWTDPEGTPVALSLDPTDPMLINDLDIEITKGGSTYYPWSLDRSSPASAATNAGDNTVDNVEQVYIASPTTENYTITVTHKGTLVDDGGSTSSQQFGLIISGVANLIPDITVNPITFSETLGLNQTEQQTLTITNDGNSGSTLNYDIIIPETSGREVTSSPKSNYPAEDIRIDQIEAVPVKYKSSSNNTDVTTIKHHTGLTQILSFTGYSGVFNCAARFNSTELATYYTNNEITQIKIVIYTNDYTNCTIKVWEGGSLGNPGSEIYSQDITSSVVFEGWTTHTLTSPVTLISGNEYWIGYSLTYTGSGNPFGIDSGPRVNDKGGLYQYNEGSWSQIDSYNWCIEMVIDESLAELTLTSPNGNEIWANTESHNITWNHSGGTLANVKLELSTNNGTGYSNIIASTLNDGIFEWTVSGSASEQCLVRVSDPAVPSTNDVSNAVFEIYDTVTWLSIDQDNGSLGQGSTDNLTLTFDSSGLSAGTYNANIEITSNDPDEATVIIPVTLTVNDNSSSGSGNNGGGSGSADVDMPLTNIDGNSVNPDVSIDPNPNAGITVNVTVTDEVQGSVPVAYPENVIISYAVDVIGTIDGVNLAFDIEFTGLTGLDQIHWLNGTIWQVPNNVSWSTPDHVTFNLTLTDRNASTEIILSSDGPLPVSLSSFTAIYSNGSPTINWVTQSESDNIGWNIYRANSSNLGQAFILNLETIPGNGTTSQPSFYSFTDEYDVQENSTYWYWLESISSAGETEMFGPVSLTIPSEGNNIPEIPLVTELRQNFPNPFNPCTLISFDIKENETGVLSIYNIKGQLIVTKEFETGRHNYTWDAREQSSGVYLYKLQTENFTEIKKMLLLK